MTDSKLPEPSVAWLFFVIPDDPKKLAAALVDNYVLFENCLLVDPDAARMSAWMKHHAGAPYRTYLDLDDSTDDVDAVLMAVMGCGRPAFAYWPPHKSEGGDVRGGYAFTDGQHRIDWWWLEDAVGPPDESSRMMRRAGVGAQDIEVMQDVITSIHRRQRKT